MSDDERRPKDHADEAVGRTAEAAELAEHIRDTEPRHTREEQFGLLVEIIDDAHKNALEASVGLDDE